jgi:hypothetical protein
VPTTRHPFDDKIVEPCHKTFREFFRFLSVDHSRHQYWEILECTRKLKAISDFETDGITEIDTECGVDLLRPVVII